MLLRVLAALSACALAMPLSAANPTAETIAGRFFGTLPEPSCAAKDVLLSLRPDGEYALQAHCQDDLQVSPVRRGHWRVHGTCVLLTPPDPASSRILVFAIHEEDLLVLATAGCAEPIEDPRGRTLRRALDDTGND